ncbi:MAG TPA: glycosyltransferase family A protein, partial [Nitrospirota bacterium]|nr:glycosyltransferase family A protein [Nitrospirota bacterium]
MLISVIVPTFNRALMVEKTIYSVLNQTYKDIEIIVVDDGSTDNTNEVIRRIETSASRTVRYIKKTNGGCSSARNMGIRNAEGDAVAFLDSDDQFLPGALESLAGALLASQADFVYSPSIEVSVTGKEGINIPAAPGRPDEFSRKHFFTLRARSCCIL